MSSVEPVTLDSYCLPPLGPHSPFPETKTLTKQAVESDIDDLARSADYCEEFVKV